MKSRPTSHLATALGKVELFEDLSRKELTFVANQCRHESFRAGAMIVEEGDASGRFYLIHAGEVEVLVKGKSVARMGADDYFGEMAVIDKAKRSAAVRTVVDTEVSSLAPFNFRALMREHPSITLKLLIRMCARVRSLDASMTTS